MKLHAEPLSSLCFSMDGIIFLRSYDLIWISKSSTSVYRCILSSTWVFVCSHSDKYNLPSVFTVFGFDISLRTSILFRWNDNIFIYTASLRAEAAAIAGSDNTELRTISAKVYNISICFPLLLDAQIFSSQTMPEILFY